MSLFQSIVINQYAKNLDSKALESAWQSFSNCFLNPSKQANIRVAKEEQYQEGFLRDLFVDVLGYTLNPEPNYNLISEFKNLKSSKKADGAILKNGYAISVIELKGMDTTDLNKVEDQAFSYKNNHTHCRYVITSNFQKVRLYIDNAVEYIEFNLFTMSKESFTHFYLLLHCNSLLNDLPNEIKSASLSQEEAITKQLYKDYAAFKHDLFTDLALNNPSEDSLILFQKSQKLLDRLLFIFFSEDRGLLPANFAKGIISEWKKLKALKMPTSLYEQIKRYFGFINTGYKDEQSEIFAYNGGLFRPDTLLDNVTISNHVLEPHIQRLSEYDFASEVDVNILGHIFENSLTELDEVKAKLAGEKVDKSKTKRKKDGVFYTPNYITKYILEQTLGELCNSKKTELKINEDDYYQEVAVNKTGRKRIKSAAKMEKEKKALDRLRAYQHWLLRVKICDPACGSGAFLNEALNFLIKEHAYILELETKLFGSGLAYPDIENSILENNLFGVDINEESVEIAKLSLWLRTAQPHRKLNDLSNNIKCGNSLIDDLGVTDKAFDWKSEFPTVFSEDDKGGFDIIIGNPPYGAKLPKDIQKWLNKRYITGGSETAISFIKLGYSELLKANGLFGFIIPKSFTYSSNYKAIREYVRDDVTTIIDGKKVWSEVKLEQIILILSKNSNTLIYSSGSIADKNIEITGEIPKTTFDDFELYLNDISNTELDIGMKVRKPTTRLNDIAVNSRGSALQKLIIDDSNQTPVLGGAEIQREGIVGIKGYILEDSVEGNTKCRIANNSILVQNIVSHIQNPKDHIKITACYPLTKNFVIIDTINQITVENTCSSKVIWLLLNSKLINWYCYRFIFAKAVRTMHFDNAVTERIPIPDDVNDAELIKLADSLLVDFERLQVITDKFVRSIQRNFTIESMSKKLINWHKLTYKDFVKELKNSNVKLSLSEEAEWEDYFLLESDKAKLLSSSLKKSKDDADNRIFAMYGLTDEQKKIIMNDYGD